MRLRPELVAFERADGGLDLLDLVLESEHRFDAEEAAVLRRLARLGEGEVPAALAARLDAGLLLEGPGAAILREGARHGRVRSRIPAPAIAVDAGAREAFAEAERLPELVAPGWRDPERWRRLAEDRLAGRVLSRLEGFLSPGAADALRSAAERLPFVREESLYVRGDGCAVAGEELGPMIEAFRRGPLHALVGRVMGEALPSRLFLRAWRLSAGDHIATHKDGLHYVTTFSLGLCDGWTAGHGGAIAFGRPVAEGLEIVERWLPHRGDLLLFRPSAQAWHAVEAVARGTRFTVTGQYVAEAYPGGASG